MQSDVYVGVYKRRLAKLQYIKITARKKEANYDFQYNDKSLWWLSSQ